MRMGLRLCFRICKLRSIRGCCWERHCAEPSALLLSEVLPDGAFPFLVESIDFLDQCLGAVLDLPASGVQGDAVSELQKQLVPCRCKVAFLAGQSALPESLGMV